MRPMAAPDVVTTTNVFVKIQPPLSESLHQDLLVVSGFQGLLARDSNTYAIFFATPSPPRLNQLYSLTGGRPNAT